MWSKLYVLIRPLRYTVAFLAFLNFMAIATALRFTASEDDTSSISFMDFQQIVINGAIFVACVYSAFGRTMWTSAYRGVIVAIVCVLSLIYSISLLLHIQSQGGCASPFFTEVRTRCIIQYVVSGIEILWTVLLAIETVIRHFQSRDVDWLNKMRIEEEERAMAGAVHYQPDLSLYGNGSPAGAPRFSEIDGDAYAVPSSVELESLPAYMPRPDKDQPIIIDLANNTTQQQAPMYYQPPTTPPPPHFTDASGSASTSAGLSAQPRTAVASGSPSSAPAPGGPPLPSYVP
ncbi:hypothetical protein BGZ99_008833 [Dissophora globulifera]|uniref:Uncharacterized protein n=1 Tax=Dissophora globulifera TaxID=979702 RepID=A0A9P6UN20_9FUNG|nr:hypothetical protein BGZ99_008833 [Dissophora globulifera]